MRFLLDQDVYASTARFLVGLGHDVVTAAQAGLAQKADLELLRVTHEQHRILVTRDRDYGSLVFVQGCEGGVVYLRMSPSTMNAVHAATGADPNHLRRARATICLCRGGGGKPPYSPASPGRGA